MTAALGAMALSAAIAAPGASAAAANHEVTRTDGAVSATLSWRGEFQDTKNFRILITRDNAAVVSEAVEIADCGPGGESTYACPWPVGDNPLELRDLDGDGEPEAVITAFTGGANCCVVALVYRWNGTEYVTVERNFFTAGWTLVDLDKDGTVEFKSRDARFDSIYGSHAGSVYPIQILSFAAGKFVDVTEDFPKQIARDKRGLKREYKRRANSRKRLEVRAALAAYVADLYLLDRKPAARRVLKHALEDGVLDRSRFDPVGPFGRKFVRNLKRTLRRFGYA